MLPRYRITRSLSLLSTAAIIPRCKTLVLSDFHIGIEHELLSHGLLVPKTHFKQLLAQLTAMMDAAKPERVIITGDFKHSFGAISDQEWRDGATLLDVLTNSSECILIKGNHDPFLPPIAKKRNIRIEDSFRIGNALLVHGDVLPAPAKLKGISLIIIGHEHPAYRVQSNLRSEIFKCFIWGRWKRRRLLVLPSSNPLYVGTDIREGSFGPFMKDLTNREYFVLGDRFYLFPEPKE
ncbi:MAG: metallophosphoesterase [Nanoarchaeota archaeon]